MQHIIRLSIIQRLLIPTFVPVLAVTSSPLHAGSRNSKRRAQSDPRTEARRARQKDTNWFKKKEKWISVAAQAADAHVLLTSHHSSLGSGGTHSNFWRKVQNPESETQAETGGQQARLSNRFCEMLVSAAAPSHCASACQQTADRMREGVCTLGGFQLFCAPCWFWKWNVVHVHYAIIFQYLIRGWVQLPPPPPPCFLPHSSPVVLNPR